jgi:hypothetical protein
MAVSAVPSPRRRWYLVLALAILAGATWSAARAAPGVGAPRTRGLGAAQRTSATAVPAYWLVASDGGVFAFGGMPFYGSMGGQHLNKPMVGMASTTDGKGYWTVASDGGIFSYGDAHFYGSLGSTPLNEPVVGMAADPATYGYWLVASDGGVFSFGAAFYGSMGGTPLNEPVVGMAATPDGGGYWLFASDGGVFSFGDAHFYGSMGGTPLDKPIVGGAATTDGKGYWLVASDGGVFSFGDAAYLGSLGGQPLTHPIAAMAVADPGGYWMTDDNGAVTAFGDAGYFGSAPQVLDAPVVGMADGPGTGAWAGSPYQSGAYGYDVSGYQCRSTLPSGHAIGIVKAYQYPLGQPQSPAAGVNPCLSQEAAWAGAGLNLYIYMEGGTSSQSEPSCSGTYASSCDLGYLEAADAYRFAAATSGVNPDVTWWLDVESDPSWSQTTAANVAVIEGAMAALRDDGINDVGVYYSPDGWNPIVGDYQPAVPSWVAWWGNSGAYDCANLASYAAAHNLQLPSGPVWLAQYSDDAATQPDGQPVDGDYSC